MVYLETGSCDPTYNLAFEEYCQKKLTRFPALLLLWQNDNAVIIGRYQNAEKEVNVSAVERLGVKLVRRSTGGGAVYHDMGNLNYSFIRPIENPEQMDVHAVAKPMADALNAIGIPAELQGRNDITIGGRKISGTAQSVYRGRLLHHGTLLYDSNLGILQEVLNVDPTKLLSKGVASVRSRVANIRGAMGWDKDLAQFWAELRGAFGTLEHYEPTHAELDEIRTLQAEKYQSWDWNCGHAPKYTFFNEKRFPGGKVEVSLEVQQGRIGACRITGDFLGLVDIQGLEDALTGLQHNLGSVREALGRIPLSLYLGSVGAEELMMCMFESMLT